GEHHADDEDGGDPHPAQPLTRNAAWPGCHLRIRLSRTPPGLERIRIGRGHVAGFGQAASSATSASMYCTAERTPPNIQMPSGNRCTVPFGTNGRSVLIGLSASPSAYRSGPVEMM